MNEIKNLGNKENQTIVVPNVFKIGNELTRIVTVNNYVHIMGVLTKDIATMECRLRLVMVYETGEVTPAHEYRLSTLSEKALADLADLDGISSTCIKGILDAIKKKRSQLKTVTDREKKCSVTQVYQALSEYVSTREEPSKVFVHDGYGYIEYGYLPTVLRKLDCGYERLELAKVFKTFGLLRIQSGTGHEYTCMVNNRAYLAKGWYFAFKLMETEDDKEAA